MPHPNIRTVNLSKTLNITCCKQLTKRSQWIHQRVGSGKQRTLCSYKPLSHFGLFFFNTLHCLWYVLLFLWHLLHWPCWDTLFSHSNRKNNFFKVKHENMRFENRNISWPLIIEGIMKKSVVSCSTQVLHLYLFHSKLKYGILKRIITHLSVQSMIFS